MTRFENYDNTNGQAIKNDQCHYTHYNFTILLVFCIEETDEKLPTVGYGLIQFGIYCKDLFLLYG
jgi:hypothetical protein